MSDVLNWIKNRDLDLGATAHYAAIIGESPSKGAKSPSLWNAAFATMNLSAVMHPMDVRLRDLPSLIAALKADPRFIGGAVTMPYKIQIIAHLDRIEPEAHLIGAVNCIYRDADSLVGANTDGSGAIWALQKALIKQLTGSRALLIGTGGAGYAVSGYLATALGSGGRLWLANRSADSSHKLAARLQDLCPTETVAWPPVQSMAAEIDLLINCTSIGFGALRRDAAGAYCLRWYTPLGAVPSEHRSLASDDAQAERQYLRLAAEDIGDNLSASLAFMSATRRPFVMDIIYQPRQTILLQLAEHFGLQVLNGMTMNLEQAVIGFDKVTVAACLRSGAPDAVRRAMENVY